MQREILTPANLYRDEYYFEEDNKYSNMYYENIGVKGQAVGP